MIPVPKLPSLMFSAKLGARGPATISAVVISADGEAGNSPKASANAAPGTKLAAKLADCAGVMLGKRRLGGVGFIISLTEPPRLYPKMSTLRDVTAIPHEIEVSTQYIQPSFKCNHRDR